MLNHPLDNVKILPTLEKAAGAYNVCRFFDNASHTLQVLSDSDSDHADCGSDSDREAQISVLEDSKAPAKIALASSRSRRSDADPPHYPRIGVARSHDSLSPHVRVRSQKRWSCVSCGNLMVRSAFAIIPARDYRMLSVRHSC